MTAESMPALRRTVLAAAWVSVAVFGACLALGQQSKSDAKREDENGVIEGKRYLADMQTLADTVQVTAGEGEASKSAKLIPKPIYRFSDLKRFISDGTLWAWGIGGRPLVIAEFHTGDRLQPDWGQWLQATSDMPVAAVIGGHGRWASRETDFKLLAITDIGVPTESEAGRLRQMKRFARTLSASSEWRGQQFELRLLTTEVYRYSDADLGLIDGAVFVFAVDSNPEAILFVEAHKADADRGAPASWKYALHRMSAATLTFRRGDTEVWEVPESYGGPRATHYAFTRTVPRGLKGSE